MRRLRGKLTDGKKTECVAHGRSGGWYYPAAVWALLMAVMLALSACGNSGADGVQAVQEQAAEPEEEQSDIRSDGSSPKEGQSGIESGDSLSEEGQPRMESGGSSSEEEQSGALEKEQQTGAPESGQPQGSGQSKEEIKERGLDRIIGSYETEPVFEVPEYSGAAYIAVNDNTPYFTKSELPTESFEYYSDLDALGRCGVVCANIGQDIMPTEERGDIGQVKPTGWHTVKYDTVDGKYLYNRCHLIGYQLSAENANEKNLITGTRYLNIKGMLPFENMVADYVKETGNHVLYRVSPIFEGDDLVAYGVLMEGWSVEDNGEGICFNVFAYNVQPGIVIDYASGESYAGEDAAVSQESVGAESAQTSQAGADSAGKNSGQAQQGDTGKQETASAGTDYILNTRSKIFHYPSCRSVKQMAEENKQYYTGSREDVIAMEYKPCGNCNP